ncbi:MAG: MarR family transcriptional regulator [Phycisphaerae bacterium]
MPDTQATLDKMAAEIFELYQLVALARMRRPSEADDLSEAEFLALDLLSKERTMTIGEVQKRVGVLPAQMSRIVRALEKEGGRGYVECSINPDDRRRIDVSLTPAGRAAYEKYRSIRLGSMYESLTVLDPDDRVHFMQMLRQIRTAFEQRLSE